MMNEDLNQIPYSRILNYNYPVWFQEIQLNDKILSDSEREEFVAVFDDVIAQYAEGLPMMHETLKRNEDLHDEYHELERTIVSVILFVLITMIDCLVASKYFILAKNDYERRFMRGKLKVILNEGFKQLYGFDKKTHEKSKWDRILPILKYYSHEINLQYQDLTFLLERHSHSSTWWRDERNYETHLEAEMLYTSRQEEIVESKVMMDSMKLFNTLDAVNHFLSNLHGCLLNALILKYHRGELRE